MDYKFIRTSFLLAICLLLGIVINDHSDLYSEKNIATMKKTNT